ncbi:MAG: Gfo/Idh/MocA family oxidoreductase [Pirellulales bacterium]
MVRVGLVGIGFMGWIHYLAYRQVAGVELRAICSRDAKKRGGDWRGIQGNFGPPGEQIDVSGLAAYERLEELLADPQIDLVDLCLPPAQHADAAVAALEAGKHVFCEKPMALTDADCQRMVAASERSGRQLFVGHVLPLFPEYAFAYQAAVDGTYGRVLGGYFKRVISDPTWLADFYDPQRVGGPLLDLHVHDAHYIRLLFGTPSAVSSVGRMRGEVVEFCHTVFDYPGDTAGGGRYAVSASSGVINQQGRPFTHGFEIHFERATLQFEFAVIGGEGRLMMPLTVYAADGSVHTPALSDGDPTLAFVGEIQEVARCVESGQPSRVLGAELAQDAIRLCHCQTESVRSGRTVVVQASRLP